ncbi:MAG: FAD-dependent oxidoreductase [Adlercreutzia mucosicola]|uniref:FAD-dependent oxidoreductase n=1 Tax=Adlercreutzia mucosicola TaxID=580026 RepID=A0A6N8JKM6_9ACTN|nr:FAD-dependent oxidoreductase [Adlercreutzia mucosicola]MCI9494532.1 FAD-dependent oxidoreductase [Adlercreutzia mucosicola]MVX60202.1 FAD-dependent oxidoreductase [Adlercreutzia mucosicola]
MTETHDFSRRDFLKLGAVGAAGAAAAAGLAACSPAGNTGSGGTGGSGSGSGSAAAEGTVSTNDVVIKLGDKMPTWSFMVPPEPIPADQITETKENDIIVVGAGMSGLTTAVAAAEKGGKVTLFSASSAPISRGGSNYARNSKVMEELKVEPFNPVPFYYHEMRAASFAIDQRKWMRGYNESEEAMNWMIDIASEAGLSVILERDNNFDLGPHYAHAFSTLGDSAMVSTGQQGAVEALEKKALEYGVEIVYDMKAEQLIREDGGRVTGVVASKINGSGEGYVQFNGKYIVLATGDYSLDKEMLACYCPEALDVVGFDQVETDYNTSFQMGGIYGGDGQKMGLWIGAAWQRAEAAPMYQGGWGGGHEPLGFHWGLNVNTRAERYQREDVSAPYTAHHLLSQPDMKAFGIWTKNYPQAIIDRGQEWFLFGSDYTLPPKTAEEMIQIWDAGAEEGSYFKADTLEDLAKQLELDPAKLKETVAHYNELVKAGEDTDFYKDPTYLVEIEETGPYYAAVNTCTFMTIMGGLRTSADMEVCDENDEPIPGLFNVGCMIGDMYANEYNFAIPGNSYGINCLTFGYTLGHRLAAGDFA